MVTLRCLLRQTWKLELRNADTVNSQKKPLGMYWVDAQISNNLETDQWETKQNSKGFLLNTAMRFESSQETREKDQISTPQKPKMVSH